MTGHNLLIHSLITKTKKHEKITLGSIYSAYRNIFLLVKSVTRSGEVIQPSTLFQNEYSF
jgi:hypothetical protein